ncbi:MAG: hypothetical protein LBU32_23240 [Clostridiales bacterium]|jgi:hypothetical protein|nr:hypothetical protein [Clostridiales bacterium]
MDCGRMYDFTARRWASASFALLFYSTNFGSYDFKLSFSKQALSSDLEVGCTGASKKGTFDEKRYNLKEDYSFLCWIFSRILLICLRSSQMNEIR